MLDNGFLHYNYLLRRARKLIIGASRTGGRNFSGRITSFKVGGGSFHKVVIFIDFWRRLPLDLFVVKIRRDPSRSAPLALVFSKAGYLSYIVLPEVFLSGDRLGFTLNRPALKKHLVSISPYGPKAIKDELPPFNFLGSSLPLSYVPEGMMVYNIEFWPFKGAQMCRAAGTSAVFVKMRDGLVTLKLRSGWKIVLSGSCYATLGVSPNSRHMYSSLRKAGLVRNLGRRPTVRGVAMNSIDHPHGGGRGKTSGGPRPLTPWGRLTKQTPTVSRRARLAKFRKRYR